MTLYMGQAFGTSRQKIKLAGKLGVKHKKACFKQAFDTICGISFGLRRVVR